MYQFDESLTLTQNLTRLLRSIEITGDELGALEQKGLAPPRLVVRRLKGIEAQWESAFQKHAEIARNLERSLRRIERLQPPADELAEGHLERLYTILASLPGDPTTPPRRRGRLQGDPTTGPRRKKKQPG